ncbi:MAG: HAD-IIIC family phosphatase [Cyanobacteriota bacterium]|nr:HAD-IIIC family phosphatase [Cyanobacteriota bacterium]
MMASEITSPAGSTRLVDALQRLVVDHGYGAYASVTNALSCPLGDALPTCKVAVLRNFTVEPLLPVLEGELALLGRRAAIHLGGLDTMVQDALGGSDSPLHAQPELVIVAAWLPGLSLRLCERFASLQAEGIHAEVHALLETIEQILLGVRERTQAPILLNNFPLPPHPALGVADAQSKHQQTQTLLAVNQHLLDLRTQIPNLYIVDYFCTFARLGAALCWDHRGWHLARAPLGSKALVDIGRQYAALIRALQGKSRKVLVLDCDDTLWGGVLGEDGMGGIRIGETHPGSAYQAFQRAVLNLKDRGILLALASKNNEADVMEVLRTHPGMVIREEDLAAWQIHWGDKANSLRLLANELGLGLDAFVFADDNPFECDLVRQTLPEVSVIHLKGNPTGFPDLLHEGYLFDALVFSTEDQRRTTMYLGERERKRLRSDANTLEDYLCKLKLVAEIREVDATTLPRIAQLTQKTNQFNLTSRRYSESDIAFFANDSSMRVYGMRLRDRIDDLGLIGAAILRLEGNGASIDTFLISCRALGRGAETALLAYVVKDVRRHGYSQIRGEFCPTSRNGQVADFYSRHGFLPDVSLGVGFSILPASVEIASPSYIHFHDLEDKSSDGKH